ncbi:MAG: hypothetical protein R3A13_11960 [Bdellovibrionota bacterium]
MKELNKLEERFKNLSEQYRRGNSSVRVQLEDVKSKLDKKIEETNKYTQEILISSIGELQSGISELLDWKRKLEDEKTETLRMQKAQDQINQFYAVVGALTDVCSLVSPEAAKIINGIGSVVGSIMSASLSGFAFGPVVGVVSSVIGFIGSLFSSPGPSLAEYVEKRFDRIESMLENMYKSLVERLNIIDQKVSLLMRFAEDNKDFQFEHRRRLAEIGFGVDRNSALLDQMALRLDQQVKTNFIEDVETSLRSYVDSVNSGSEVKPLKPDPEKWLKDFVDLGRQFSSEALFIGTYSPTNGDLDRSIRLRGLEFSEGLIFDAINRLLQSQHILGTDSPRNGLVISDAVISALKVQESWPQNYPRLSEEHARELKSYLDQRLAFYEKLTSKLVIEALATEYEKAVTAVILRLAELLKSEAFMQLCGIPSGIDLTRGLDQRIPPIFSPKGSVIPERKTGGFNVHFDHLRKFLTWQLRQELGGEIEFAPVPAELKPDIDLSPDLFNFNAEHILRTLMGYSVPVGDGKSEQTKPEASLALENHLTFLLSSPIVLTKEKQLVIPVFIKSVKVGGSAKEGNAEFEDIYHNAFYDHLELNSRITFKFLVSALKSTLDLNNLGVREISHIEFTPDKAYPIALWFKHASGPEASSVPGVEIKEDLYGSLCANWNERYNQMVGTSAEFSLRVLQHLVNRKVPMLLASESYKTVYEHLRANGVNITEAEWKRQNSIQIGKGTLGSNDITGVRLQVDHNGYHRILISIGGLGTYVIERSDAEILLKEMLASGDLVENYLNTNSYLPAALNREVDTFDLNLEVVGLNRQDDKTPAEKRYQLLERRSAAALLKYQEAFKALYDAMLILDDRSILMRSAIGLSVPDEILGSAELLYAVREDTGFLTSDYLLLKLAEISAGNLSFKDLFRILIDRKTEPTKNLKLGLDKLKPEEIQYGAARIRMAYVLLEEYLQQFNTEK